MRIELNAGGLSGLVAIATFENDIHALDQRIEDMIDSFQTVKNAVGDLAGGVDTLSGAVESLRQRIRQEEQKKVNLKDLETRFGDFLDLAVSVDRSVAQLVRQNQEEFFSLNEHLRPRITMDDLRWIPIVRFVDDLFTVGEVIAEFISDHWEAIAVVAVSVVIAAAGIVVIVATGGTALAAIGVVLGGGLILGGVGMGTGGMKSYINTGHVDIGDALIGFWCGFVAGAAIGTGIHSGVVLLKQSSMLLKFAGLFMDGFLTSAGMDFFGQTVLEGTEINGLEGYNPIQTAAEGLIGAGFNMIFGGIFKIAGLEKVIQNWGWNISNEITRKMVGKGFVNWSSSFLGHSIQFTAVKIFPSFLQNSTKQLVNMGTGLQDEFEWKTLAVDTFMDVIFDVGRDYDEKMNYPANYDPALPAVQPDNLPMVQQDITEAFDFSESLRNGSADVPGVRKPIEVEYFDTAADCFGENVVDIKRTDLLKQQYSGTGDSIRSHDLSSASYQTEEGMMSVLRKDIRQTKGDTLRIFVADDDLSIPQISAFRRAAEEAEKEGIQLILMPQRVTAY